MDRSGSKRRTRETIVLESTIVRREYQAHLLRRPVTRNDRESRSRCADQWPRRNGGKRSRTLQGICTPPPRPTRMAFQIARSVNLWPIAIPL